MRWIDGLSLLLVVCIMTALTYTAQVGPFYWRADQGLVAPEPATAVDPSAEHADQDDPYPLSAASSQNRR